MIINTIILAGAIQGFIFSGFAFFSKKYKSLANFFLGMLILTFSYHNLQNYLIVANIFSEDAYFRIFYIPFTTVFLTLFYLYIKYFLYPKNKIQKKDYYLFIPFLIAFTESVLEKIGFAIGIFETESHTKYFNIFRLCQEIFSIFYSIVLIVAGLRLIAVFERNRKAGMPKIKTNWLKIVSYILLFLCLFWGYPLATELYPEINPFDFNFYYVAWIGLLFAIYILGHVGLYQYGIVQEQKNLHKFSANRAASIIVETNVSKNEHLVAFEKLIRQDKNYLDSNLSLELVAEKIDINKSYLSRIINAELGKNFSDYVNELRVEEAKSYLENPEFQNYTLVAIGLEAGFNSKSVFNTAFKKITGMTPSEYKKNCK